MADFRCVSELARLLHCLGHRGAAPVFKGVTIMFQAKLIAVAIALTAPVAVAAKDAPVVKAPAAATAAVSPERGTARTERADTLRYCIKDTVTGSRISRKECRTRSDWLARGFDPLEAK